jgi:hypothetical protein
MGGQRDRQKLEAERPSEQRRVATADAPQTYVLTLQGIAGNQAVQRLLKGGPGFPFPFSDPFRQERRHKGIWREYAEPRLTPEQLQGLLTIQLPPQLDLRAAESIDPNRRSDEFIVASDKFGVTITHPASESQVRVVEKEHRYKPEDWTYETTKWPNETPAISYDLVKGQDGGASQLLVATGPGAWVEISEPAPYEGAKEPELRDEWEHGIRPMRFGTFDVTIIEMPDSALVPLPGENIDVQMLLAAGGKLRDPDRRTWRGAMTQNEIVMAWGMIIAQLAMMAIPFGVELLDAALFATEAAEAADAVAGDVVMDIPLRGGEPVIEPESGVIPEPEAPPISAAAAEPATATADQALDGVVTELGGPRQGYSIRICDDSTVIETPTSLDNAGISARHAGGAETNVQTRTIWVHESVVRGNGVVRPWGARLNLKQVVAHEMGHVDSGEFRCSFASRAGAELPGLTEAERAGLLDDAAHIAEREGVAFEHLKFPPGFEPPE